MCDGCLIGFQDELQACKVDQQSILRARALNNILMQEPLRGINKQFSIRLPNSEEVRKIIFFEGLNYVVNKEGKEIGKK